MIQFMILILPWRHRKPLLRFPCSDPRYVHPSPLEDIMTEHVCFALFVGRHGARGEVHGGEGACASTLGQRAWVDAEDGVDDLERKQSVCKSVA